MKTRKTEGHGLVPAVRGDGAVAAPDFAEVLVEGGGLADGHAAERIRRHLAAADILGRISLAHAVAAGWELACQKAQIGWGGWERWCRQELGFSKDSAERYIGLFRKTVGAAREAIGIADESPLTRDEVEKATAAVDATTATGAMVELGIVRRNPDHGGRREGAGRKPKDPAAEAVAAAADDDPDLNWAECGGHLKALHDFAVGEDGFGKLADDDLETAVVMLGEIEARAKALLKARREGGAE